MHRTALTLVVIPLAAGVAALGSPAFADVVQWTGAAGDGLWKTAANWTPHLPTAADSVFITSAGSDFVTIANSTAHAGALLSSHPIQLFNGGKLEVEGDSQLNGGLYMYANGSVPSIVNSGAMSVGQVMSVFDGAIFQDAAAAFTIDTDCTATFWDAQFGFSLWGGYVLNRGAMVLKDSIQVGSSIAPTVLVNEPEGSVTIEGTDDGLTGWTQEQSTTFINYGTCTFLVGGHIGPEIATYNPGTVVASYETLSIADFAEVDAAGTLLEGSYFMYNGARIETNTGNIVTIPDGVTVVMAGTNGDGGPAHLTGIERAENIFGTLAVDGGAQVQLAPAFFGTVKNHGKISVGPGSTLSVLGSYVCGADATHAIVVADASPSGIGKFQTYQGMLLDGTLQVDFYDDTLLATPGNSFVVASLVDPSCCLIEGSFDAIATFPPTGDPSYVTYTGGAVTLVAGTPGACTGDLDESGAVDGADLGQLLANWGGAGTGDLDGSGTVDGADLGMLLAGWGGCV